MTDRTYRIREFAALAAVTVRALHHYDRLGLLKPRRTATGYRVYCAKDLETLEQIVALKFIGLPLNKIKPLLRRNPIDLSSALRAQGALLEQRKGLLERAITAIGQAEATLQTGGDVDSGVFRHIIEVIEMQNKSEEWNQKYDTLVQGKIERLKSMSPEAKAQLQMQWTNLFTDVERALNEEPASARAQELAERWVKLLGAFIPQGATLDPQVLKNYGAAHQPAGEWPAGVRQPEGPLADKRIWDFMQRALAVRP
jgi:MerR family transcriptional regulator, thiopeptide resistance regulator